MAARGSFVASGSLYPGTIVKLDTTSGNTGKVLQAGAGDNCVGVTALGKRNAPLAGLDDGYAAIAGENVRVYTSSDPEDMPVVQVDAAYAQGTKIKPGTNGIGTSAASDGDIYIGELAEASSAANQYVQIRVTGPKYVGA